MKSKRRRNSRGEKKKVEEIARERRRRRRRRRRRSYKIDNIRPNLRLLVEEELFNDGPVLFMKAGVVNSHAKGQSQLQVRVSNA